MSRSILILLAALAQNGGAAAGPPSDAGLAASVHQLPPSVLAAECDGSRARKIVRAYYDSIRDWGDVLHKRFQPVPGRPGCGYYGRGGHLENDVRPIAYAAMVNAFLAEARPPRPFTGSLEQITTDGKFPEDGQRARYRREAVAVLRYLTRSHVTGEGACLDGKPWGDQWQSAMWARAAGMAAWILWPQLDERLRAATARMVEHEADRFLDKQPKSSVFRDTGAEENAWNATLLTLASNMMPGHPRAARWDEAGRRYMYNSLSVAADQRDDAPGDFDRPVRRWVTTVNAHPDFTVENHGLVHIGYLKNTLTMLMESASHYQVVGKPIPRACFHHVADSLDVLLRCAAWDGAPVFFGGNDWKTYHSQAIDVLLYAMINVATGDRRTAYLEETALGWLRRIQELEGGFYNVRRDLEYGGVCATRLVTCYFARATNGAGANPLSPEEFDRAVGGVTHLEYAQAILHRTPTKFASFSWGPKRMALALPRDGNWALWPHFSAYLGIVGGKDSSWRSAELVHLNHSVGTDGFCVAGSLKRLGGRLVQDFAFASPAADVTIYVERLTTADGFRLTDRQTGVVGHEYPLGCNERVVHGAFGAKRIVGLGGQTTVHQWRTDWLNLGDRIGYVIRREPDRENLVRYHDLAKGSGRVPKLQEWLSLIGDEDPGRWSRPTDWVCLVTLLNQTTEQTAHWARKVRFSVDGDTATCRVGDDVLHVDFATSDARLDTKGETRP